jgi:hypothetical protein
MSALNEIRLFRESEGISAGEGPGLGGGKFLVLRDEKLDRYFREWLRLGAQTKFLWVSSLVCARGIPLNDRLLAESFQRFILDRAHIPTVLYVVERNRLLSQIQPAPRKITRTAVKPHIAIVDLKKRLRDYRL